MITKKHRTLFALALLLPVLAFSQRKKKEEFVFLSIPEVQVDGDIAEWADQLYNAESDIWSCGISVQGDSIYAAVVIKDPALQREALLGGVVFNLSHNAKKRDGARLIFPIADREGLRALLHADDATTRDDYRQDFFNTSRGYYVFGFDRVMDGLLSYDNTYGIRAVITLDSNRMVYEAVIPLDRVVFKSDQIAVKIGVNTHYGRALASQRKQPAPSRDPYGRPKAPPATPKNPYGEPTEIWVTGSLK